MTETIVVVGAGFKGFCDCLQLSEKTDRKIYLVDPSPEFGGIMASVRFKEFYVDKGVHIFDSGSAELARVTREVMDGQVREVDLVSHSAISGKVTHGFPFPDLYSLDDESLRNKITREVIDLASQELLPADGLSLADLFRNRYGETGGKVFSDIFANIYRIDADEVDARAISQTGLGRMKFLDDEQMKLLKQHPRLDQVLGARLKATGATEQWEPLYPDTGEGMKGWCVRAEKWLKDRGVIFRLGEKVEQLDCAKEGVTVTTDKGEIKADWVIWSNDNVNALANAMGFEADISPWQHRTPLMLVTMVTEADKIRDLTYLYNFDPKGLSYRIAAMGIFSNQITSEGDSFIISECPVELGGEEWNAPAETGENCWQECKKLGVVAEDATLKDIHVARIPGSFHMPKVGYYEQIEKFHNEVEARSRRVIFRNTAPFFRRDIYDDSLLLPAMLDGLGKKAG